MYIHWIRIGLSEQWISTGLDNPQGVQKWVGNDSPKEDKRKRPTHECRESAKV